MPRIATETIDRLADDFFPNANDPGCSVMILDEQNTSFHSRGIADLESCSRIESSTNFRLASVAKQFTAACILILRDNGQVSLDQTITDFFPDFSAYGKRIQLEHLLRHTSGIMDYEKLIPEDETKPLVDNDVVALLAAQSQADFEAGARFRYSNSGYAVLAAVVEKVSGMAYPAYLRKNIFEPLGMENTLAFIDRPDMPTVPHRAIGYSLNDAGEFVWSDQNITTAVLGDGGIYCSTGDYEKWIRAYMAGEVLKPATVTEAWTPRKTNSDDLVPYGYGWRLEKLNGHWRPYHPGSTSGFRNGSVVDARNNYAVLVLSNRCNGDAVALATEIERLIILNTVN